MNGSINGKLWTIVCFRKIRCIHLCSVDDTFHFFVITVVVLQLQVAGHVLRKLFHPFHVADAVVWNSIRINGVVTVECLRRQRIVESGIRSFFIRDDQAGNSGRHRSGREKVVWRYRFRWFDLDLVQAVDVVLQLGRRDADSLLDEIVHEGLVEVDRRYAADLALAHPEASAGGRSGILYGRTLGASPAGTSSSIGHVKTAVCCRDG